MNVDKQERNKYFSLYFDIINVCVLCKKVNSVDDIFDILVSNSILNIDKKNIAHVTSLLREYSEVLENITKRVNTYDSLCLFEEELRIGQNMLKSYEYKYIDLAANKYAKNIDEANIFSASKKMNYLNKIVVCPSNKKLVWNKTSKTDQLKTTI